jgi:hypothetical protein
VIATETENTNWHLWSDGARNGLRVMKPVGGGVGYYWNYTKRTWEYYGHHRIER